MEQDTPYGTEQNEKNYLPISQMYLDKFLFDPTTLLAILKCSKLSLLLQITMFESGLHKCGYWPLRPNNYIKIPAFAVLDQTKNPYFVIFNGSSET